MSVESEPRLDVPTNGHEVNGAGADPELDALRATSEYNEKLEEARSVVSGLTVPELDEELELGARLVRTNGDNKAVKEMAVRDSVYVAIDELADRKGLDDGQRASLRGSWDRFMNGEDDLGFDDADDDTMGFEMGLEQLNSPHNNGGDPSESTGSTVLHPGDPEAGLYPITRGNEVLRPDNEDTVHPGDAKAGLYPITARRKRQPSTEEATGRHPGDPEAGLPPVVPRNERQPDRSNGLPSVPTATQSAPSAETIDPSDIKELTARRWRKGYVATTENGKVKMGADDILRTYGYDPEVQGEDGVQGRNPDTSGRLDRIKNRLDEAYERRDERLSRDIRTKEDFTDEYGNVDYNAWHEAARDDLARIRSRSQFKSFLSKRKEQIALDNYLDAFDARTSLKLIKEQREKGEVYDDEKIDLEARKLFFEDSAERNGLEKKHLKQSVKGKFLNWFSSQGIVKKALITAPVGVGITVGSGLALTAAGGGLVAAGIVGGVTGVAKFGRSKWRSNANKARDDQLDKAVKFRTEAEEYHMEAAQNEADDHTADPSLDQDTRTFLRVAGISDIAGEGIEKLSRHERRQARISASVGALAIVGGANIDRVAGFMRHIDAGKWLSDRWRTITHLAGGAANHHDGAIDAREAAQDRVPDWAEFAGRAEDYRDLHDAHLSDGQIKEILSNPDHEAFGRYVSAARDLKEATGLSDEDVADRLASGLERLSEFPVESGHGITNEIADQWPGLSGEQYGAIYQQLHEEFGDNILEGVPTYTMENGDVGIGAPGNAHWAPGVAEAVDRMIREQLRDQTTDLDE